MPYRIVITEIKTKTVVARGEYTVVDTRPWTDEELDDSAWNPREEFLKATPLKEVRGHAPDRKVEKTEETEVFTQTVADLDLPAVIKAVNGIS